MSAMHVDLGALATMASDLDAGARRLEHAADSAPGAVDAGPMTAVIAAMLSQVTSSAGNVSTSMSAAADVVRDCRTYYERADAEAAAGLDEIRAAVEAGR